MSSLRTRAALGISLAVAAGAAHAHGVAKEVGDFYGGALHPVTALEHVLPFLALGIFVGQQGQRVASALLVFAVMLMVGATAARWLPMSVYIDLFNIVSAIVLGGLIAAARQLPLAIVQVIVVAFGLSHGMANGAAISGAIKPYLFIPGVGLAGLIVPAWTMIATDWVLRKEVGWMRIAVRVAGSWIAAIGVLVLAASARAVLNS